MAFSTFGPLASGSVLDLGLGNLTQDELAQQDEEKRKKKRLAAANGNPGAYGDGSQSPMSQHLFGIL